MSPTSSWSRSQPPKDEVNMSIGPLPDLYKWIMISGTFVVTRFVIGDDCCFCDMSGWVSSASVISTMVVIAWLVRTARFSRDVTTDANNHKTRLLLH
ncbi:hypothetical protein Tco_1058331 [Tanacetum coccineum]|uniref:Uncharacterized protein n=1 Tax=Tanacetum coccineum TaxID=301880 RepID=A0ABQ5H8N1_9ASTR